MKQEFLIKSLREDLHRAHFIKEENLKPNYSGGLKYNDSFEDLWEDRAFQTKDVLEKVMDWNKN